VLTRNDKRHTNGIQILEAMPQTIAHGAEERAAKLAGQLSGQIKERVGGVPLDLKDARLTAKEAKLSVKEARLGLRQRLAAGVLARSMPKRRRSRLVPPSTDAMLKAQLVKTSRELAHESSDLGAAVDSLNRIIRANRRVAAKGRTRLLGGFALGAAMMYHLDAERGHERRAATARLLTNMVRGQDGPPSAAA
jgi:hypothetical protein